MLLVFSIFRVISQSKVHLSLSFDYEPPRTDYIVYILNAQLYISKKCYRACPYIYVLHEIWFRSELLFPGRDLGLLMFGGQGLLFNSKGGVKLSPPPFLSTASARRSFECLFRAELCR